MQSGGGHHANKASVHSRNSGQSLNPSRKDQFAEIVGLIKDLREFRFIERIVRPIRDSERFKLVEEYKRKLFFLNSEIQKLERQTVAARVKSLKEGPKVSETRNMVNPPRQSVRRVETEYLGLLVNGSFKHYQKIAHFYRLPSNLQVLDIGLWASLMLEPPPSLTCCQKLCQ